jgi:LPXTG-motif cell wall-anchored protein
MTRSERIPLEDPVTKNLISSPNGSPRSDLVRDLVLPTLLFTALGGMTWAVRGCAGFGAWKGCVFAGVTWGTAWWYLAHDPRKEQSRRYASAWIVVALTFGIGIAGIQGWMQWPSLFEGKLMMNATPKVDRFVPISRAYGFLWLFLAGAKWAGIGACLLAWCGSLRETRVWHWFWRIACGLTGAYLARFLIVHYPQHFVPLYGSMQAQYADLKANPNLGRMMIDCTEAVYHLGLCFGFLVFEIVRRDWKNVTLILTVSLVNGAGWALCQNWNWAHHIWKDGSFNFWRCWESSGGLCMGVAFGLGYFLVNRPMSDRERALVASRRSISGANFEWLLIFLGLAWLLSITFRLEVPWRLPLPQWAADRLHRDYLEWSAFFFSVVCAFGAAYYFANRSTPIDERGGRRGFSGFLEPFGLFLTVMLIVGLFIPIRQYADWGRKLRIAQGIDHLSEFVLRLTTFLGPSHSPARRRFDSTGITVMELALAGMMLLGIGWYFVRRRKFESEKTATTPLDGDPNLERLGLYLGLFAGLGLSIQYGVKGCLLIYGYYEDIWDPCLQHILAPYYVIALCAILAWILRRPVSRDLRGEIFPHASATMWLVLLVQNAIAQAITGPPSNWQEVAFNIYYALLFAITAVTIVHFQSLKRLEALRS